ncbi:hypothetical protein [Brachybacterium tyrofermentans]|uniref:Uncharacterized protein n=1 Tax=Brachybacterium tyrofermentans TaxID=47848 RepID=A0ABW0FK25_9MICO
MSQPPSSMPQYGGPMSTPPSSPMPPPPPKKKRTGLIIGIVAGALFLIIAVLVVIALIIFFAVRGGGGDTTGGGGDGGGGGDKSATPEEQATTLVTDYMDALVAGDSTTAFELVADPSPSDEMLPAAAYDAALAAAPIADVAVEAPVMDPDGMDGTVPVSFTVGGEATTYEFSVSDYDSDEVLELSSPMWASYSPDSLAGLGATINGEELPTDVSIAMLPGSYEIALGVEGFAPSTDEPLVYTDYDSDIEWPEATLTEDGLTTFRAAVQKSVDACIAQDTLKAGCGIGELPATTDDGYTLTDGTVKRTLPEDAQRTIDKMTATPSYDEPTFVEGEYIGTIDTKMECEKDGQKGTCEMWLGGGLGTPSVDMADPKHPVTWS